jgi:restriction endonuclease Mrr
MMKDTLSPSQLPSESEVIAELEDYLISMPRPVTLSETYRALADRFGLTHEERTRLMPNRNEIHWENRVRQARRKLKDAGKLDSSLKWSGKFGRSAKVYPTLKNGYSNDDETPIFGQIQSHSGA